MQVLKNFVSSLSSQTPKRAFNPNAPLLGRLGNLVTRLACNEAEIRAAQAIRYQVFYEELKAVASPSLQLLKRDEDKFDDYCDHLLVIDRSEHAEKIVGTYRLLQDNQALFAGGYYSESEFDLTSLKASSKGNKLMELGRSCILQEYRSKRVMELLWQGAWAYSNNERIDIMFGCASFPGTCPSEHSKALSWLAHNACLDEGDCSPSKTHQVLHLKDMPEYHTDQRRIIAALPPLLKGYLRLGAKFGSHAVIDPQFDTIDVLVVLRVSDINPRYLAHYGSDASRFAA